MKIQDQILKDITERLANVNTSFGVVNIGRVEQVGDGVVIASGLSLGKMGELVEFESGAKGLVLNLKNEGCGIIVFGDYEAIREGEQVRGTGKVLAIKATSAYLGRVINPLGEPIDGLGDIKALHNFREMLVEKIAPGIVERESVNKPLQTGIKIIDTITPVGRGQRELIIGDRNTGKTALVIDTIINQERLNKKKKVKKVISIYVAIGQKQSKISQVVSKLASEDALENTIVVAANSSDPISLQYLAPYAGSAIAEYFMENGEDVLIAYDDLTKHAWAYRQISLILRRPSGREAYPGDVFYLHSRLLERACKLNAKNGGGSITALPIIETQAQDISAYIPTNVISITDGQIYLEQDLFYQGIRPAVNAGLSVSRVGGAAQLKAVKQVAGKLRLELAQFNELSGFAQFGSDLDAATKAKIDRGLRITEILKQPQYKPVPVEEQVLLIWVVTHGYLDDTHLEQVTSKATDFVLFAKSKSADLSEKLTLPEGITDDMETKLVRLADSFFKKINGINR